MNSELLYGYKDERENENENENEKENSGYNDHYLETASLDQQSKSKHPRQLYCPSVTEPLLAGQLDPLQAQQSTDKHTRKPTSYPRKKKAASKPFTGNGQFEPIDKEAGRHLHLPVSLPRSGSIQAAPAEGIIIPQQQFRPGHPHQMEDKNVGLLASLRRYPRGVFFVLGNEFCERFSFYGMRSILLLYLVNEHGFSDSSASFFYHAFISLAYFSPLFGSIAADNYFGRFRVILWVSLFYVAGHGLLSVGAIPYLPHLPRSILDFGGLAVIALATGGIKPCVSAFAADQFDEDRHQERTQFFSFFYFAINAGSLVAIMLTPILRGRVRCFGSQFCFPLAFGVPGVLMFVAFIIFLCGWRFYKITPAGKGNVIWKVCTCIGSALKGKVNAKLRFRGQDTAQHWLDYAAPKYSEKNLLPGVKSLVAVSILFVPIVFFWALFDQQGSTWVLQARRMDGRVGPLTILPDQMNTFNPLIIIIMVPIFEAYIYPCLRKVCNVTPLRKMAAGGILAALAFVMAGLLQLKVNQTMEPKPSPGNVFIQRIGNSQVNYTSDTGLQLSLESKNEWPAGNYTINGPKSSFELDLREEKCGYIIGIFDLNGGNGQSKTLFSYSCEKSDNGMTKIYLMLEESSPLYGTPVYLVDHNNEINKKLDIRPGQIIDIVPGFISYPDYIIAYGNCKENANSTSPVTCDQEMKFHAQMGAAYVLNLVDDGRKTTADPQILEGTLTELVRPNSISMLWQLPQFFVITLGEVLFSVTGLEFSYSQAAPTMKSVLQAFWLLTTFFGNVIDMGISGTHLIKEPATEFFFYALLMAIVIGVFVAIALNYTYVDEHAMEASLSISSSSEEDPAEKDPAANGDTNQVHRRSSKKTPLTPPPLSSVSPSEKDSKC